MEKNTNKYLEGNKSDDLFREQEMFVFLIASR